MISGLPITGIIKQQDKSWLFTWTATSAAYYRVVLNGKLIANVTSGTSYIFKLPNYPKYPPPLEIMEETALALSEQFQPFLVIQWYYEACDSFIVQEFINSAWVNIRTVFNNGTFVFSVQTPLLADGSAHEYGVLAVTKGLESSVEEFNIVVVTPPIFVDGSVNFNYASGDVVVSAT